MSVYYDYARPHEQVNDPRNERARVVRVAGARFFVRINNTGKPLPAKLSQGITNIEPGDDVLVYVSPPNSITIIGIVSKYKSGVSSLRDV